MLAAFGFLVAEQFHPLFGGAIDVPSYVAFQETPLQTFWPAVVLAISVAEVFSVFTFESPFGGETWAIRKDYEAGNLGFDPAGLKPAGATELRGMQNAELNNGRAPPTIYSHRSLSALYGAPTKRRQNGHTAHTHAPLHCHSGPPHY